MNRIKNFSLALPELNSGFLLLCNMLYKFYHENVLVIYNHPSEPYEIFLQTTHEFPTIVHFFDAVRSLNGGFWVCVDNLFYALHVYLFVFQSKSYNSLKIIKHNIIKCKFFRNYS